ncbi:MAG: hypothetical protein ACE5H9_16415 [Anaerolineae bacterium]
MSPYLLLSLLFGGIYGAAFHVWKGQSARDLALYLVAGVLGFGLGQLVGNQLGFNLFLIGPVHVVEATLTSWLVLFVTKWLKI